MKNRISLIRWAFLLPVLGLAFFIAHFVFQLMFPMIQTHLGISDDDLYGMSIMDQDVVFGPYGGGIFAFFSILSCYMITPRAKIAVSLAILFLELLPCLGVRSFIIAISGAGLAALFSAMIVHRVFGWIGHSRTTIAT
jgi:hypothetical protein